MMRAAKRSKTSHSTARRNNVSAAKKVAEDLTLRSFVHALGTTQASQADAARWMGVSTSTVQKVVAGTVPVNVKHVLRSQHLAVPFVRFLCRLVLKHYLSDGAGRVR